ncbi:MAG: hypothetical protein PHQ36_04415 [Anaerolineales bacterium]|nr:hypothetical protein [Anaerolineales bacterium]
MNKIGIRFFTEKSLTRHDVLGAYAVIVLLVYSWTLITSFYKFPSWMFYLTLGQIGAIYAYAFSINFIESIVTLAGVSFLEFTLFLFLKNKEEILPRSILAALILLGTAMWRLVLFQDYVDSAAFVSGELKWWLLTFAVGAPAVIFAAKIKWIKKILEGLADRALVFLYIYLPLTALAIVVVIIRNIN